MWRGRCREACPPDEIKKCRQPITVNGLLRPHKMALIGLDQILHKGQHGKPPISSKIKASSYSPSTGPTAWYINPGRSEIPWQPINRIGSAWNGRQQLALFGARN